MPASVPAATTQRSAGGGRSPGREGAGQIQPSSTTATPGSAAAPAPALASPLQRPAALEEERARPGRPSPSPCQPRPRRPAFSTAAPATPVPASPLHRRAGRPSPPLHRPGGGEKREGVRARRPPPLLRRRCRAKGEWREREGGSNYDPSQINITNDELK
ncbi:Os06g0516250 [Oryza sativa Japonica Group]|uniref:Os06g0516250 protein n=1 Tax=Oryza sativa subsp. japonica TaxID=39947 RepID=A0A0P0WXJ3_ORYSJ|nr:Os06g0516250 [Oryza sativa Japonica Group]